MEGISQLLETAESLYEQLQNALSLPSVRDTYHVLSRVLHLAASQQTQFNALHLGSLYARIDYLSREHHLDGALTHAINDTRARLRRLRLLDDARLSRMLSDDLSAITLFIEAVYGQVVPEALEAMITRQLKPIVCPRTDGVEVKMQASFRLYVDHFDDKYLYGTSDDHEAEGEIMVCYNFSARSLDGDWTYLRPYLKGNVQFNVVRPRLFNGIYFPELLILDPDYLVDVTAIAGCYEDYAHDARLRLISLLSPAEDTQAIMLGSLASQLLDEEVHSAGQQAVDYDQSYQTFLRDNTFKALTVGIDDLYVQGRQQQQNIHTALHKGLAKRIGHYDPSQVMLEPSFYSERLGISGRMDMLQLDYHVLLEQKSGKGGWEPGMRPGDPPIYQPKHFVQVLLYLAILNYNYEVPNREIQALLLYSKYPNGLIGVSSAPKVLCEAIRLRNEIAGNAALCCQPGYLQGVLDMLTPDSFMLLPGCRPSYYQNYIQPRFERVLDPIRKASDLERAYFFRLFAFVSNEQTLAKVGNKTKESSGFASKWHDSLEEKYQAGNIYDQLELLDPDPMHQGAVSHLVLTFTPDRASEMSNFRQGDIVIAYPYKIGEEPDARCTMVFRCTIESIDPDTLTLQLRAPQSDHHVFTRYDASVWQWAVEHDLMDSGNSSLFGGLHAFLRAPQQRRDLLMLQRQPRIDVTATLRGDYGAFNELALHVRQAQDFFIIIGPPGTGKTSYGMLYTLQEQLLEPGTNVLITSYTNRAVDEICGKLVEREIPFLRIGKALSSAAEYHPYLLSNQLAEAGSLEAMHRLVEETRVVIGTTASLSSNLPLFRLKHFDLAIIDEASQILEPHLLPLLSAMRPEGSDIPAISKFVMIGDHKQLPAVVQQRPEESMVSDPELRAIGLTDCRLSLFERLLRRYRNDPQVVYLLTRQGRMHRDIADFPSQMFYGGKLLPVPLPHQVSATQVTTVTDVSTALASRITFLDCQLSGQSLHQSQNDHVNPLEARVIAQLLIRIYEEAGEAFDVQNTVGVIVPYRNQISAIRAALSTLLGEKAVMSDGTVHPLFAISIDTVERFQGSQRDYILYGFTVSYRYQLNFLADNTFEEDGQLIDRKLNVAMTRARLHLVMVGNAALLSLNQVFASLINYVRAHEGFCTVDAEKGLKQ